MRDDGAMTSDRTPGATVEALARAAASAKVLIVDDEQALAGVIGSYFTRDGYDVSFAHDGPGAVETARRVVPDLVLLDLMLPGFDGLEVCRQLRAFSDAYVLMLTARGDDVDKIVGLSVGADDYVVKPASPRELLARASAMLRRPRSLPGTSADEQPARVVGDLVLDPVARTVVVAGRPVELTRTEFDLLAVLIAKPRAAYERRQLIDEVWGVTWFGDEHLVDVHVAHLRRKLGDDSSSPRYIRTVRGVGYGLAGATS